MPSFHNILCKAWMQTMSQWSDELPLTAITASRFKPDTYASAIKELCATVHNCTSLRIAPVRCFTFHVPHGAMALPSASLDGFMSCCLLELPPFHCGWWLPPVFPAVRHGRLRGSVAAARAARVSEKRRRSCGGQTQQRRTSLSRSSFFVFVFVFAGRNSRSS